MEERGFAFHSHHTLGVSVKSSERYRASNQSSNMSNKIEKQFKSPVSARLSSPVNSHWLDETKFPSPIREKETPPRKTSRQNRGSVKSSHASRSPQQRKKNKASESPNTRRPALKKTVVGSPYAVKPVLVTKEEICEESLQSKMILRIKKKQQSANPQNTTLRISARKPSYQKGVFEPVNPNRQRITAIDCSLPPSELQNAVNSHSVNTESLSSGDPFANNIVIFGDSEKIHPIKSSRKGSPLS